MNKNHSLKLNRNKTPKPSLPFEVLDRIENVFNLVKNSRSVFNACDVRKECAKVGIQKHFVSLALPRIFRSQISSHEIVKTGGFSISEHDFSPVLEYTKKNK